MTDNEETIGARGIYEVLSALAHRGFTIDDEELRAKISPFLPEKSATDPRPEIGRAHV